MSLETPQCGSPNQSLNRLRVCSRSFSSMGGPLVWKLAITTTAMGGLVVSNFYKYFLAGQLTFFHCWLTTPFDDTSVSLEAACVGSYKAHSHPVYRGLKDPYSFTSSMHLVIKAWSIKHGFTLSSTGRLSPHVALWRNPNLTLFFDYPDPVVWTKYGIKTLQHIISNGSLMAFNDLK